MKLKFILIICLFTRVYSQQNLKIQVNQIDFSRYPKVDIYATFQYDNFEPFNLDISKIKDLTVIHNNENVSISEISSVMDLKEKGETELYIALAFDNSSSMSSRTKLLEDAACEFVNQLRVGDYVSIFDFGTEGTKHKIDEMKDPIVSNKKTDFLNSKKFLLERIPIKGLTGKTYLYDEAVYALSELNKMNVMGRKALVLFSDGDDNASEADYDDVINLALKYDIPIYAIDLGNRENSSLEKIAKESKGGYFFIKRPEELKPLYQNIAKILKSQYRLSFTTNDASSNQHAVNITMKGGFRGTDAKTFTIDGEKLGYTMLIYLESIGKDNITDYMNFLENNPRSKYADNVKLKIASFWKNRGEFEKAYGALKILVRYPSSPVYGQAMTQLAELYSMTKDYKRARNSYQKILESGLQQGTEKGKTLFNLAKSYQAEGNYQMAFNTYNQISSEYAGSDVAADALFEMASVNVEMGNLPNAQANLKNIVQNYPDTKVATFSKVELAKIAEKSDNKKEAVEIYKELSEKKNIDRELRIQSKMKIATLSLQEKDFNKSNAVFQEIVDDPDVPLNIKNDASFSLVYSLLNCGKVLEAQNVFRTMPPSMQTKFIEQYPVLNVVTPEKPMTYLANGAYVTKASGSDFNKKSAVTNKNNNETSIQIGLILSETDKLFDKLNPDLAIQTANGFEPASKFAVLGPVYLLNNLAIGGKVSIPVEKEWIKDNKIKKGEGGIYFYNEETRQWEPITLDLDAATGCYVFECKNKGVYALLGQRPKIIKLFNIYFDLNKATIKKEAEKNLYELIDNLKSMPDIKLEIGGHTDSTGTDEENMILSQKRADAVKDFLVMNGIESARLVSKGYGEKYPLVANNTDDNRRKNRRTEFTFIQSTNDTATVRRTQKRVFAVVNFYKNSKEAYEKKKFYAKYNFLLDVINIDDPNYSGMYALILGIYSNENEAKIDALKFQSYFKNTLVQILSY